MFLFPIHIVILVGVICLLLFGAIPLINFAIGAKTKVARRSRGARLKKAGILFLIAIVGFAYNSAVGPDLTEYPRYFVDCFCVTFVIAAIVFLFPAPSVKNGSPKSDGPVKQKLES